MVNPSGFDVNIIGISNKSNDNYDLKPLKVDKKKLFDSVQLMTFIFHT